MIQASRTKESDNEFKITSNSLSDPQPNQPLTPPPWLKRARIICALIYILIQTAYFIFIIVCIALYPRCEPAGETPWWINSVFLRFSSRSMTFNDLNQKLDYYKNNFTMQALWMRPVLPLSNKSNPLTWIGVDEHLGEASDLTNLINKVHENNIQIIADYPLNQLSIQSISNYNDAYFVWNKEGNTSDWMINQQALWIYNNEKSSYYLNQYPNNNDAIDINYRNNRVFNDIIHSFSFWNQTFQFDGFNLQGISYTYEDYEYKNQTDYDNYNQSRTRHLDENYLLLARIRSEIDKKKILLFDSLDSSSTPNEQLLTRYYGDKNGYLGGVQLASLNDFILNNETETNLTILFNNYYNSVFYAENQPILWSSLSTNSRLNEAFFAACLFHIGAISIDINQQGEYFSNEQLNRLRQIIKFARTLDVFRVGSIQPTILPNSQWLTVERARRGSKHHMIIINFSPTEQEDTITLTEGNTNAVEILLTNIENPGAKYEKNALIDLSEPIRLKSYEYIIIRWSPSIEGLKIIF